MRIKISIVAMLGLALLAPGPLMSAAPVIPPALTTRIVNYQGQLTDSGGIPYNSSVNLTFQVFDVVTGGAALMTHAETVVPSTQGLFNVEIPLSGVAVDQMANGLWVEVQVNGQILTPRKRLLGSAYALNSDSLRGLIPGSGSGNIPVLDNTGRLDPAVVSSPFPLDVVGSAVGGYGALVSNTNNGATQQGLRVSASNAISATATDASGFAIRGATTPLDNSSASAILAISNFGVGVRATAGGGAAALLSSSASIGVWTHGIYGMQASASAVGLRVGGSSLVAGQTAQTPVTGIEVNSTLRGILITNSGNAPGLQATNSAPASALLGLNGSASGVGVEGQHTGSGFGAGLIGRSSSSGGKAIVADSSATLGATYGVYASAASPAGTGLYAFAPSRGVRGEATAGTGAAWGVYGLATSVDGVGTQGEATGAATAFGVYGQALSSVGGAAVYGVGLNKGVWGVANADGTGVAGVVGEAAAQGVIGRALRSSGADTRGVEGYAASADGSAIYGELVANPGAGKGVWGRALGAGASGIYGQGGTRGVYGEAPGGSAGQRGVEGYVAGAGQDRSGVLGSVNANPGEVVYGVRGRLTTTGNSGYAVQGDNSSASGRAMRAYNSAARGGDSGYALGVTGKLKLTEDNADSYVDSRSGPQGAWDVLCAYCGSGDLVLVTPQIDITLGGTVPNALYVDPAEVINGQFTVRAPSTVAGMRFYYMVIDK